MCNETFVIQIEYIHNRSKPKFNNTINSEVGQKKKINKKKLLLKKETHITLHHL